MVDCPFMSPGVVLLPSWCLLPEGVNIRGVLMQCYPPHCLVVNPGLGLCRFNTSLDTKTIVRCPFFDCDDTCVCSSACM